MVDWHEKRDGSLRRGGLNMWLPKEHAGEIATGIELILSNRDEKGQQIENVRNWREGRNTVLLPFPRRRRMVGMGSLLPATYQTPRTSRIFRTPNGIGAMCSRR